MSAVPGFDVERIRKDFPVLTRELPGGRPLVYLDSGNSSQKPPRWSRPCATT